MTQGAVFSLPVATGDRLGPVAGYITTAGWAAAARKSLGHAWIVTPQGVITPEEAREQASKPVVKSSGPRWRRRLPTVAVTALKDVRAVGRSVGSRLQGSTVPPWAGVDVAFVWERHALFHHEGRALAQTIGCPYVLSVHALQVREAASWGVHRPWWGRLVERWEEARAFRSAALVACVSEEVAVGVRELGVAPERVLVTANGVDLDHFNVSVSGEAVRTRFGLHDAFVVGWAGSFRRFHGVDLAIRAVAGLQDDVPEIALLLVGDGLDRERVEQLGRRLGLRRLVMTGAVPYREMPRYVRAMDVALVLAGDPAAFHYSPVKLREYMACGRPVIAHAVGELARELEDGTDALLIRPGDAEVLGTAIRRLIAHPPLRADLGHEAARRVAAGGSWDAAFARLQDALAAVTSPVP